MEASSNDNLTFREAIAGKWQIPLFIVSVLSFLAVMIHERPIVEVPSFDDKYAELVVLSDDARYQDFYTNAELLRQETETNEELSKVHYLVAQTRVKQLRQRNELGLDVPAGKGSQVNFDNVVNDYRVALRDGAVDPNSVDAVPVYSDLSDVFWGMNDTEMAIDFLNRAIALTPEYDFTLNKSLIRMYQMARPRGYMDKVLSLLEEMLVQPNLSTEDKAWAFVRKVETLIALGREEDALVMLNAADDDIRQSQFGDEITLMRGRALRRKGDGDQADLILRELLERIRDRGDVYAQVNLELGKINYEQFRDFDARQFYQNVVNSQTGNDWYVAGRLGLAECAALQQRYDEAVSHYEEVVQQLNDSPANKAVTKEGVQQSLALLANQLSLLKRYSQALPFLELEQKIASDKDIDAANRFAWLHYRMAMELSDKYEKAKAGTDEQELTDDENEWNTQQEQVIAAHFNEAARQFLRVADLVVGDDQLYGDCLWHAAVCYDKAGESQDSIDTWTKFVEQRQGNTRWPEALFNLAQAYQSIGGYDEAISYYKTLNQVHPNSPAAFDSIVPLAQCMLAKEEPDRQAAETLLQSLLKNPALTPTSPYFRQAMFELGQLYFENEQYDQCISKLTEAIDRYPNDSGLGKYMFLVGESYRRSGLALDDVLGKLADDPTATVSRERTEGVRRSHLTRAQDYFRQAIDFYETRPEGRRSDLDELYLRHSWMYQADCMYDLALYNEAVTLYEEVALRYQLTPTALQAFVQIVNCHVNLGNPEEAASANRRAIWQLAKMSDDALVDSAGGKTRTEWQQWFNWVEQSGLW